MVFLPASVTSHLTLFHLMLGVTLGVALVDAQGHMGHNASTMPSMAPSMDNSSMTMHHGPTHEMSNGTSKNMMTSGTGHMMMNNGTHPMTNNGTTNSTGSMNHGQTMSNGTMSHGNTMPDGGAHGTQSTGSMTHGGAHGTPSTGTMPPGGGHGSGHGSGHPQSTGTMPPGSGHGAGHPTDGSSVATAGGGHGSGHGSGGGSTSGHYGFFHITFNTVILFEQWITNSWQGLLASCVGIAVAATLYEGLKVLRSALAKRARKRFSGKFTEAPTLAQKMCSGHHILQAVLHTVQAVYSYMLMLVFMTFNLWLCLSVALGFGLGYLFFRVNESSSDDSNEHCM